MEDRERKRERNRDSERHRERERERERESGGMSIPPIRMTSLYAKRMIRELFTLLGTPKITF